MAGAPSQPDVKYRIGAVSAFFIVSTALFYDALGFLLMLTGIGAIVTEILGITGSILFFFWFMLLRVSFISGKATAKLGVMGAGTVIEMIPFLNGISPTFTIATVAVIHLSRKEDKEKAEKERKERAQAVQKTQQREENIAAQYILRRRQMEQQVPNDT